MFADWLNLVQKIIAGLALPSAVTIYYKWSRGCTGKVINQPAENIHKTLKRWVLLVLTRKQILVSKVLNEMGSLENILCPWCWSKECSLQHYFCWTAALRPGARFCSQLQINNKSGHIVLKLVCILKLRLSSWEQSEVLRQTQFSFGFSCAFVKQS